MELASKRLFFALWPDAGAARQLHDTARELQALCGGRVMARDSLHLTLAFLGQVPLARLPELEALGAGLAARPFALQVDRLGYWAHNHILWAGCQEPGAALMALAGVLQDRLRAADFALDVRPFAPHVTLLRKAERESPLPLARTISWPVGEVLLVESMPGEATRYVALKRWPLGVD